MLILETWLCYLLKLAPRAAGTAAELLVCQSVILLPLYSCKCAGLQSLPFR